MKKITTGLVITTVGGPGPFGYKQSYNKNHPINTIIEEVFQEEGMDFITYPFNIHGSDERQYSSQGFRINTASITKDKYYEYPQYHTSLDNMDFVKPEQIKHTLNLHLKALAKLNTLESLTFPLESRLLRLAPFTYKSLYPNCEVMLSKHDLYPKTGGGQVPKTGDRDELDITLWLLFWCDGQHTLSDIAEKLSVDGKALETIAHRLEKKGVLGRVTA